MRRKDPQYLYTSIDSNISGIEIIIFFLRMDAN